MSTLSYHDKRLAYHEAGHALIAFEQGFEVHSIVLGRKQSGQAVISPRLSGRSTEEYALARIRVLVAGAIAECLALHPGQPSCTLEAFGERGNARHDWIKAEELARLIIHMRSEGADDDASMAASVDRLLQEQIQAVAGSIEGSRATLYSLATRGMAALRELFEQDPDGDGWVAEAVITQDELVHLFSEQLGRQAF